MRFTSNFQAEVILDLLVGATFVSLPRSSIAKAPFRAVSCHYGGKCSGGVRRSREAAPPGGGGARVDAARLAKGIPGFSELPEEVLGGIRKEIGAIKGKPRPFGLFGDGERARASAWGLGTCQQGYFAGKLFGEGAFHAATGRKEPGPVQGNRGEDIRF